MQIEKTTPPETPQLITVTSLDNSIPKNRYVVYYEIPIFAGQFKPIDEIKDLLVIDGVLRFKILDLEDVGAKPIFKSSAFGSKGSDNVELGFKFVEGEIVIKGKIINKSNQTGSVFSLTVTEITGYLNFLKFRQKYRTLQNITRKQTFKLDHRLKIIDNGSVFYFSLQESDTTHYFFTNPKLSLQVQEIYSVQDWQSIEIVFEDVLDLSGADGCSRATISIMQKIKIVLAIELIRNANLSVCQMAALRVLQAENDCGTVSVGTDRVGEMAKIEPVLERRFYDYEYGYMNENLKEEKSSTIYEHIGKLTKSFPDYPHLKNSKLLDISGSKFLTFSFSKNKKETIRVPFVYILMGFNIIQTENFKIKFYLEFCGQKSQNLKDKVEDTRRIIEIKVRDVWNLGLLGKLYRNFTIKITSAGDSYVIPFTSTEVDTKQFRKQEKQLQLKEQYSYFQGNKYFVLARTNGNNEKKLLLTKTEAINPFYLLDLFCSASVNFQVISQGEVVLQGTVGRQNVVGVAQSSGELRAIMSSPDNLLKVVLILGCSEIKLKNSSQRTYYKLMYKLEYTDSIPSDKLHYDLEVRRLTDNKKQRAKLYPQISDDGVSTLHNFQDGFFEATADDIELQLSMRKMYYNEETEVFDNGEVINKKIVVNATPKQVLEKGCLFMIIKEEGYSSLDFDFYDENAKKRLRLHLEVYMKKLPLLDLNKGRYTLKVPQYLWQLNKFSFPGSQITLQSHLSNRKKKGQKLSIFPDSPQEYILQQYNYKDGISLKIDDEIGYERVIDAVKVTCDVTKEQIGWVENSQWYLGSINVGEGVFWFMIKWGFDANGVWDDSEGDAKSEKSDRTAGKKGSERSYSQKIDPLAKTVGNMELFKLKQFRNNLVLQGRHLTAKFVKRQETIINYTKKIADLEEKIAKHNVIQREVNESTGGVVKRKSNANYKKMAQFYRKICQCGKQFPKYNGYCQDCLKALKSRYETYLKEYKQKSYEYERLYFNKFNTKQKYIKVKNKLKHYKDRLKAGQDIDDSNFNDVFAQMENSQIKRKIEEANIYLFRLKDEREKLEDSGKQRLNALEDLIRKQDEEIWKASTQLQRLTTELNELKMKIDRNNPGSNQP